MNRRLILRSPRYRLLQFLPITSKSQSGFFAGHESSEKGGGGGEGRRLRLTSLSNTHPLSFISRLRHCHSCWLFWSRHSQCFRNASRQFLLISSNLESKNRSLLAPPPPTQLPRNPPLPPKTINPPPPPQKKPTHTLAAHRVTFRPSRIHSSSPFPCASVLHTM